MQSLNIDPRLTGEHNPYRALLFKLTKKGYKTPRLKAPFNLWRVGERDEISRLAKLVPGFDKSTAATIRDRIAKELYRALPLDEKEEWCQRAAENYDTDKCSYDKHMKDPPSTQPEDRQMYVLSPNRVRVPNRLTYFSCIQGLSKFAQNICDLIAEATGMKVTLLAGGPEPAQQGRLQMIRYVYYIPCPLPY